jgi:cytochrome c oxidase cbb3-type subunit 3
MERWRLVVVCVATAVLAGCEREVRPFQTLPVASARAQRVTETPLHPGDAPPPATGQNSPFRENAYGIAEGKRLFGYYNCSGCHANGGGGMGPALMDDRWIYGYEAANIFQTIVEGRPNGMPSFRNKIPDQQVWMLVAYVQALSGNVPMDALPGRSDHMKTGTAENVRPALAPKLTGPW